MPLDHGLALLGQKHLLRLSVKSRCHSQCKIIPHILNASFRSSHQRRGLHVDNYSTVAQRGPQLSNRTIFPKGQHRLTAINEFQGSKHGNKPPVKPKRYFAFFNCNHSFLYLLFREIHKKLFY